MSISNTINHSTLTHLIEADAVSRACVTASDDKWLLLVYVGDNKKTVIAKNSRSPRIWRKLDTVAKYLKELGLENFEIDVSDYDPSKKTLRRPDSAATLKKTHQAHKSMQNNLSDQVVVSVEKAEKLKKEVSPTKIRERWEQRRARILEQEDPRVK